MSGRPESDPWPASSAPRSRQRNLLAAPGRTTLRPEPPFVASDPAAFCDGLAAEYQLIYGNRWNEVVVRQGADLSGLIRVALAADVAVLDCACGIGTQAIGLARQGFPSDRKGEVLSRRRDTLQSVREQLQRRPARCLRRAQAPRSRRLA